MNLPERKEFVLAALNATPLDRIRLMKTLFLVWHRHGQPSEAPFTFEPYNYGPFSKSVYTTLNELREEGLIDQIGDANPQSASYFITRAGNSVYGANRSLADELTSEIKEVAAWSAKQSFDGLLRAVYTEAPEYAENSLVRDTVLAK